MATFYTLVIICITLGTLHLAYSDVGFSYCSDGYIYYFDFTGDDVLYIGYHMCNIKNSTPGPSCSKLTMSLVNDSLKSTSSDTQIC